MFFNKMLKLVEKNSNFNPDNFQKYNIKRGLRNANGTGVLVGLTSIADVDGYDIIDGIKTPKEGKLYYRGYTLQDIVKGFQSEKRMGFEETVYLLLLGELPTKEDLTNFNAVLDSYRIFPKDFKEDMFFKIPSRNVMNKLQRVILSMYSYDEDPEDVSLEKNLSSSLNLIAKMPLMVAYSHMSAIHYFDKESLIIHQPLESKSTAENILHLIRTDSKFLQKEAEILDLCLVVHAEHGGGNNSAFATHVVSSSGTDIYSVISTAVGTLKGSRHGGANKKVAEMIENIKQNVPNWTNKSDLKDYISKIINKEVFDQKGLVYGMGHAVYTLSDPRAVLLKEKAKELSELKGFQKEFQLLDDIENITKDIFSSKNKVICANVDLYSGLVYQMLSIPKSLYTPLFAVARTAGWCAHRLEQIQDEKIIRPAYVNLCPHKQYTNMANR